MMSNRQSVFIKYNLTLLSVDLYEEHAFFLIKSKLQNIITVFVIFQIHTCNRLWGSAHAKCSTENKNFAAEKVFFAQITLRLCLFLWSLAVSVFFEEWSSRNTLNH